MRKSLWSAIALALGAVLIGGSADAADLRPVYKATPAPPPPPIYSWTGFYAGVNVGGAWGRSDLNTSFTCPVSPCTYNVPENMAAVSAAGTGSLSSSGFVGGVQAGYNWQRGSAVFGVEADIDAFRLSASRSVRGPIPTIPVSTNTVTTGYETNWLATFRGRLGWTATPTLLAYATGGLALTDLQVSNAFTDDFALPAFSATTGSSVTTQTKAGFAVGGGLEWAAWQVWSFKAEYLYVNFGSITTSANVTNPSFPTLAPNVLTTSGDLTARIARVGVNRRF